MSASVSTLRVSAPVSGLARRHPVASFAVRRTLTGLVLLLVVSILVFAATQVLPGNAAVQILGRNATPQAVAQLTRILGLDHSAVQQYGTWLGRFVQGNLGTSLAAQEPVTSLIGSRLLNSFELAAVAVLIMVPLGLALGILAGVKSDRLADQVITGTTLGAIALPEFVTGSILVALFAVGLKVLPPVSLVTPGTSPLAHPAILVLPVVTLLISGTAYISRMMRAGMIEALGSEYVESARLNGIHERRVVWLFALRNALAPTVQVVALTVQWLVGGIVVVETIFDYPGIGQLLVQSVTLRDLPVVQAITMIIAAFYIGINILADLAVVMLVPKLRTAL